MSYGAFGVLYHPATRQVLLNRRGVDAPTNPDTWGLFGGGAEVEDRGDPLTTWCREVREELGITLDPARAIPLTAYPGLVHPRRGARAPRSHRHGTAGPPGASDTAMVGGFRYLARTLHRSYFITPGSGGPRHPR